MNMLAKAAGGYKRVRELSSGRAGRIAAYREDDGRVVVQFFGDAESYEPEQIARQFAILEDWEERAPIWHITHCRTSPCPACAAKRSA